MQKQSRTNLQNINQLIFKNNSDIDSIQDFSDETFNRARVFFKNGLLLSVVFGQYSFGGNEGLFEIAVLDKNGNFKPEYFDGEDQGDQVLGYCDVKKVQYYIDKIGKYDK